MFDQIFSQVFDQIFGQGFDQGFGEGKKHKYSVQYYPALRKKSKTKKNMATKHFKHTLTAPLYAHIEALVTFLLVKHFGFWVIARYHTMRF